MSDFDPTRFEYLLEKATDDDAELSDDEIAELEAQHEAFVEVVNGMVEAIAPLIEVVIDALQPLLEMAECIEVADDD